MSLNFKSKLFPIGFLNTQTDEILLNSLSRSDKTEYVPRIENFDFDRSGDRLALVRRKGLVASGIETFDSMSGNSFGGIFQWKTREGINLLLIQSGVALYIWSGEVLNTYTSPTIYSGVYYTFVPYLNKVYIANGVNKILKYTYLTTPVESTTAPRAKYIVNHKNYLFAANIVTDVLTPSNTVDASFFKVRRDYPYKLQFSNLADFDTWTSTDFINFTSEITGICSAPVGNLLVFEKDRISIITGDVSDDFVKFTLESTVGCVSHYGIVSAAGNVYFPSSNGFYYTSGLAIPQCISRDIEAIYEKIPHNALENIQGCYDSRRNLIYWLVQLNDDYSGTIYNDRTKNACLIYDLNLKKWNMYRFNVCKHDCITMYEKGNNQVVPLITSRLIGDVDYYVRSLDGSYFYDDDGSNQFTSIYETKPMYMDNASTLKTFTKARFFIQNRTSDTFSVTFYTDNNASTTKTVPCAKITNDSRVLGLPSGFPPQLQFRLDTDKAVINYVDYVDVDINLTGHYLKLKISITDTYSDPKFLGYEIFYKNDLISSAPKNNAG